MGESSTTNNQDKNSTSFVYIEPEYSLHFWLGETIKTFNFEELKRKALYRKINKKNGY